MYNEVLDELTVVKRSGQRVEFNASKVALAIKKAFDSINDKNEDKIFKTFEKVLAFINDNYKDRKTINVEDIQDIIENTLYNQKYYDVYNSFKEYRAKRALSRKVFSEKQQHKFLKAIEKFEQKDFNNTDITSPYDLIYKFGSIIYNEYTKAYVLDTKSVRAFEEGNIYIHNLDYFSLGIMADTHLKLDERLNSTIDNLVSEIINAQKEINGEIGINNLDVILIPYILKEYKIALKSTLISYFKLFGFYELINIKKIEELIDKERNLEFNLEKYDAFIFNENIKKIFINAYEETKKQILKMVDKVILKILFNLENNVERNTKYIISCGSDISELGKIINLKIIDILNKNQFTNINIVLKISNIDKYLLNEMPSVLETNKKVFIENTNEKAEYFSTGFKLFENINDIKSSSSGRMVVSKTSINLSRLGLKYQNKTKKEFYEELDNICELVKNQLCLTFETIGNKTKENYGTLFTGNILDDEKLEEGQKIRKVIKNGVLSIGIIGLKECVISLEPNKLNQIKLINEILDFLNTKCQKFSSETKLNFGIHETTDKIARTNLLRTDKAIYGTVENITDKKHYELINIDFIDDYNELSKIQKKFKYGKLISFNLSGKISNKKLLEIFNIIEENAIEFAKIVVGKDEY